MKLGRILHKYPEQLSRKNEKNLFKKARVLENIIEHSVSLIKIQCRIVYTKPICFSLNVFIQYKSSLFFFKK